jgi:cell cycle serine/threonine-protein kinase CDC5/MSD2
MNKFKYVHRDIKIDNILIEWVEEENDYYVKLGDFGLAATLPDRDQKLYQIRGTPSYMAPELILGLGYREKCDVFSLGSVCYNLLTGRYLFND